MGLLSDGYEGDAACVMVSCTECVRGGPFRTVAVGSARVGPFPRAVEDGLALPISAGRPCHPPRHHLVESSSLRGELRRIADPHGLPCRAATPFRADTENKGEDLFMHLFGQATSNVGQMGMIGRLLSG